MITSFHALQRTVRSETGHAFCWSISITSKTSTMATLTGRVLNLKVIGEGADQTRNIWLTSAIRIL